MSTLQRPSTPSSKLWERLLARLTLSFNASNGILLSIFLIEGLWVYLWIEWVSRWNAMGWNEVPLTLPGILLILTASYYGVQTLGEQLWSDRKARIVAAVYVVGVLALVVRLENGGGYGLFDLRWSSYAGQQLTDSFGSSLQVSLLVGVYLWWRGYQLARSGIGSEQVLSSFMVGLVAIIFGLLLRELVLRSASDVGEGRGKLALITAGFFFSSLSALALSHIRKIAVDTRSHSEEPGGFNSQWPLVLLGVVSSMVLLGWLAALLFSLNVVSPILHALSFFGDILLFVLYYVVVLPIAYVAGWIVAGIVWLFSLFGPASEVELQLPGPPEFAEREGPDGEQESPWFVGLLKWSLVTLAISLAVFLLVRLLLKVRYRRPAEHADEVHESVGSWRDVVRDLLLALFTLLFWFHDRGRRMRQAVYGSLLHSRRGYGDEAQVRVLYQRLLMEARGAGFPKRAEETPFEFLDTLERHLPTQREALERLTQDYSAVRYGDQAISLEETTLLNRFWQDIYVTIHTPSNGDGHSEA